MVEKKELKTLICPICGKEFKQTAPAKKYCSDKCRRRAFNCRRRAFYEKKGKYGDKPEEERIRTCATCGRKFAATWKTQKYCSAKCAKVRHKYIVGDNSHLDEINAEARKQGKTYGQLKAEKLLERMHIEMEARVNGDVNDDS